jgi:hypothetical protein
MTRYRNSLLIGAIVIFGVLGVLYYPPFPFPSCKPLDYSKGYARITFHDPLLDKEVPDVSLFIQFLENGSTYQEVRSGEQFYVNDRSYFFALKEGYWNVSHVVYASEKMTPSLSSPPSCEAPEQCVNSSFALYKICPKDYVQIRISSIDAMRGNYTSRDIPEGYHAITFECRILGEYYNSSVWGIWTHVPSVFIPKGAYADVYDVPVQALWIGWNGSIADYAIEGDPAGMLNVYAMERWNSTLFPTFWRTMEITIRGHFSSITNAWLYYGLIDAGNNLQIPF